MRLLIRADASHEIGIGHVMRCLTLARAARQRGWAAHFVMRQAPGHLAGPVRAQAITVTLLPEDTAPGADAAATAAAARDFGADVVIVDHYALDARWETVQPAPVFVIDDMTDRRHACALLLNQNLNVTPAAYDALVPPACRRLTGAGYALLRPEFAARRTGVLADRRARPGGVRRILIAFGGTDPPNASGRILSCLAGMALPGDLGIDVVLGPTAPHLDDVRARAAALPVPARVLAGTDDMVDLMAAADLGLGAAGTTSWERCCLGLPALVAILAENQRGIAGALVDAGAARMLPLGDPRALAPALSALMREETALRRMSDAAAGVTDGRGCERVLAALTDLGTAAQAAS